MDMDEDLFEFWQDTPCRDSLQSVLWGNGFRDGWRRLRKFRKRMIFKIRLGTLGRQTPATGSKKPKAKGSGL
jgi:hypothetical protein